MKSMTGFGSASKAHKGVTVSCEIRSLNHRFLSFRQNLADGLSPMEPVFAQYLRRRLRRGSVNLTVNVTGPGTSQGPQLDKARLKAIFKDFMKIKRSLGYREPPEIEQLLQLPHLWSHNNSHGPAVPTQIVDTVVRAAIAKLVAARTREGRAARKELTRLIGRIGKTSKELIRRTPGVLAAYRRKIEDRLRRIAPGTPNQEPLYKEIASMLDKCDISEEAQRLGHHVSEFRKALSAQGPVGRRLDFMCQEMLRETNTMASKAGNTPVIDLTIRIKEDLERIKEQVENVE